MRTQVRKNVSSVEHKRNYRELIKELIARLQAWIGLSRGLKNIKALQIKNWILDPKQVT